MCDKTEIWTLAIQHEVFTALLQKQAEAQAWLQTGVTTCGPFQVPYQTSLHPSLPGVPGNRLWDRKLHVRGLPGECSQVQACEVVRKAGLGGEKSWSTVGKKVRPRSTQVETKELLWVKLCSYQEDEVPDSQDLEWMWTYLEKGSLCSPSWGHQGGPSSIRTVSLQKEEHPDGGSRLGGGQQSTLSQSMAGMVW